MAHARSIQSCTLQTTKENLPVLPDDSERNKKCPYCETSFYYVKSVETHIDHAYSDKLQPKSAPILGTNNIPSLPLQLTTLNTPVDNNVSAQTIKKPHPQIKSDVNSVKSINNTPTNELSSSKETKLLQNMNDSMCIPST